MGKIIHREIPNEEKADVVIEYLFPADEKEPVYKITLRYPSFREWLYDPDVLAIVSEKKGYTIDEIGKIREGRKNDNRRRTSKAWRTECMAIFQRN